MFHRSGLLTTSGGTVGTVPCMAPEQMTSENTLDGRSDLFSLGIVLLELISGVHPLAPQGFENETCSRSSARSSRAPRWRRGTSLPARSVRAEGLLTSRSA